MGMTNGIGFGWLRMPLSGVVLVGEHRRADFLLATLRANHAD